MTAPLADAPPATWRLFTHYDEDDLGSEAWPFVIGRLLEDGEQCDLRWLVRSVGGAELAAWLETAGARQLSRRSRAFWSTVLDVESPEGSGDELWPL